ncbi:restriction endonuclease subunit S [Anaerovibrio sp.]|uniref:restriction endonuclease subunit S n=1 Tax=Anaerovibrio sp. TaxID=1872532 RepID=UPI0025C3FA5F|nr:restriction endonuclease subunit S [Anaerovibrio sp.]MBR2143074.1 restriction endonuclease subunit S [Anaerovibrio sp.]
MSKTIPAIRIRGFTDEWEQRKLGDIASFSKGTGYSKADLQDSGTPIILYGRLYTKYETVIGEVDTFADEKPNSVFSKGGEVIVPASGETAEDISVASVVEKEGILLGGDLNIITPLADLDSTFLALSISNGKPHNDMAKMAQGKSVVHLHNSDLAKINLSYPSYEEQRQISHHFKNLDHLITLYQRKYNSLKQVKKYMLQRMFPKQGEKVPEIRFAGFTGDWEQRKVSEITSSYSGGTPQAGNSEYYDGDIPFIRSGEIHDDHTELFITNKGMENSSAKMVSKGDILYALYGATSGEVSRSNMDGAINQAILAIIPEPNYNADFLVEWFAKEKSNIIDRYLQGGQGNLSAQIIKKIDVDLPSYEEQCKIGDYFVELNNLITLYQRKVDSLKEIKKFMLQNMFPK